MFSNTIFAAAVVALTGLTEHALAKPINMTYTSDHIPIIKSALNLTGSIMDAAPVEQKRGMAYNDGNLANWFKGSCPSCYWAYNWDSDKGTLDPAINYVPMLWGPAPDHSDRWDANVETALSSGSTHLLSFNEPDFPTQANLLPADAAAAHIQWMNKYSGRALIGSPAVTNSGDPNQGLGYLQQWVDACNAQGGCNYDFCVVHWYSDAQWEETLFDHLTNAHNICGGKNIWLTEFAANDQDPNIVSGFVSDVLPRLNDLDFLARYSYFMVSADRLMSGPQATSPYGQVYATL